MSHICFFKCRNLSWICSAISLNWSRCVLHWSISWLNNMSASDFNCNFLFSITCETFTFTFHIEIWNGLKYFKQTLNFTFDSTSTSLISISLRRPVFSSIVLFLIKTYIIKYNEPFNSQICRSNFTMRLKHQFHILFCER